MKILCWDIDGTIIDTGPAGCTALDAVFEQRLHMKKPPLTMTIGGRTDRYVAWQYYIAAYKANPDAEALALFLNDYEDELYNALQAQQRALLPAAESIIKHIAEEADWENRFFTGNRARGARKKLALYGLEHCFNWKESILADQFTSKLEVAKEIKRKISGTYAEHIEKCIFIGDTPIDIQAAHHIGVKCIGISTGCYSLDELKQAHPTIVLPQLPSVEEFMQLINRL